MIILDTDCIIGLLERQSGDQIAVNRHKRHKKKYLILRLLCFVAAIFIWLIASNNVHNLPDTTHFFHFFFGLGSRILDTGEPQTEFVWIG